jgi:hypothetical protein
VQVGLHFTASTGNELQLIIHNFFRCEAFRGYPIRYHTREHGFIHGIAPVSVRQLCVDWQRGTEPDVEVRLSFSLSGGTFRLRGQCPAEGLANWAHYCIDAQMRYPVALNLAERIVRDLRRHSEEQRLATDQGPSHIRRRRQYTGQPMVMGTRGSPEIQDTEDVLRRFAAIRAYPVSAAGAFPPETTGRQSPPPVTVGRGIMDAIRQSRQGAEDDLDTLRRWMTVSASAAIDFAWEEPARPAPERKDRQGPGKARWKQHFYNKSKNKDN